MRVYRRKHGEQRTRSYFALLPVRIGLETRWMERVTVQQTFYRQRDFIGWRNEAFLEKEPE